MMRWASTRQHSYVSAGIQVESRNRNQALVQHFTWGYDQNNLKLWEERGHDAGRADVFKYDPLKRLVEAGFDAPTPQSGQFAKKENYQLDRVDNLVKIMQNIGGQEAEILTEMSPAGKKLNQYSRFDQWNLSYDQNGNLAQRGGQGFTYDYRNRMVRATESGATVNFNYDALGRRTEKTGPQGATRYYYAGNQVIEERDGSGQVKKQYIYGSGIDEVLRLDVYTGNTPTPYYFHTNQIGSTTAITDSEGNIVERVSYDTYGKPKFSDAEGQSISFSSIGNTTLFQGREYDPETGLYHYRARAYDPIMGRFLQFDPLGYVDSMNLYQAFNLNPVNYVDPLGLLIKSLVDRSWNVEYNNAEKYGLTPSKSAMALFELRDTSGLIGIKRNDDGSYSPRFRYDVELSIGALKAYSTKKKIDHERDHIEGYKWFYDRNVSKLEEIEKIKFTSRDAAIEFSIKWFYKLSNVPKKWLDWRVVSWGNLTFGIIGVDNKKHIKAWQNMKKNKSWTYDDIYEIDDDLEYDNLSKSDQDKVNKMINKLKE